MITIRLTRLGRKNRPFYRIVAADSRSPVNGKFLERLGYYNPLQTKDDHKVWHIDQERCDYWIKNGARVSYRIQKFLDRQNNTNLASIKNPTYQNINRKDIAKAKKDGKLDELLQQRNTKNDSSAQTVTDVTKTVTDVTKIHAAESEQTTIKTRDVAEEDENQNNTTQSQSKTKSNSVVENKSQVIKDAEDTTTDQKTNIDVDRQATDQNQTTVDVQGENTQNTASVETHNKETT